MTTQERMDANGRRELRLLRSYEKPQSTAAQPVVADIDPCELTVWQAARATSAGQSYFAPLIVEQRQFEDGGFGCNNPSEAAWWEARHLACAGAGGAEWTSYLLLSLGTGRAPSAPQSNLASEMAHLLTNGDTADATMLAIAANPANCLVYRRLNPTLARELPLDSASASSVNELRRLVRDWIDANVSELDDILNLILLDR